MCTILIADDELETVKQLFNSIIKENRNIKLIGITNSGKEVLNYMKQEAPDILFLDLMMPEMNGIEVLDKLIIEKEKYLTKTKIIIISSYLKTIYDSEKYRNYIYATLPKPYNINKLAYFLNEINKEIKDNKIMDYIINELSIFNFNKGTTAYRYLVETIYEIIVNDNIDFDLENEIYHKIANKNQKRIIQIKWSIDKLIATMSLNTKYNIIQEYFEFDEYKKPTTKFFIKHIIDNYYKKIENNLI